MKDPFSLRNLTVPMWQGMKSIRRIKTHKQDLRKEIWPAYAQQFARTCMACENTRGFWRFSILRPNLSFHLFFPQISRLGKWTRKSTGTSLSEKRQHLGNHPSRFDVTKKRSNSCFVFEILIKEVRLGSRAHVRHWDRSFVRCDVDYVLDMFETLRFC